MIAGDRYSQWVTSTSHLTPPAERFGGAGGKVAEGSAVERLSTVHEIEPRGEVEIETIENGGEVRGNRSAFIAAHDAAGVVDEREVVINS